MTSARDEHPGKGHQQHRRQTKTKNKTKTKRKVSRSLIPEEFRHFDSIYDAEIQDMSTASASSNGENDEDYYEPAGARTTTAVPEDASQTQQQNVFMNYLDYLENLQQQNPYRQQKPQEEEEEEPPYQQLLSDSEDEGSFLADDSYDAHFYRSAAAQEPFRSPGNTFPDNHERFEQRASDQGDDVEVVNSEDEDNSSDFDSYGYVKQALKQQQQQQSEQDQKNSFASGNSSEAEWAERQSIERQMEDQMWVGGQVTRERREKRREKILRAHTLISHTRALTHTHTHTQLHSLVAGRFSLGYNTTEDSSQV